MWWSSYTTGLDVTPAPASASGQTPAGSATAWTVYHGNPAGSGVITSVASVVTSSPRWTSPAFDGELYGEPLVSSGYVYVATENDTVYALLATDGAVAWSKHLASAIPSSDLPCGDISPTVGITGTPVLDSKRHEIFVVADELVRGSPVHYLIGLDSSTGDVEVSEDVDPPGADPAALLQRTGLTLDDGQVVFGMGGNDGDCASYRGRVVAVGEAGGSPQFFTVDAAAGDSQGAVWMGGAAPVIDEHGDIWVSTGNGSVYSASEGYDDSDGALELSSRLSLLQYFAPNSWPANNATDLDMSVAPALLSDGQVVLAGKSRFVYLLDGAHLGGIGGQLADLGPVCGEDIDGGSAVSGSVVYLPCLAGIIAVRASESPPTLTLLWNSAAGGGPPIVVGGLIWTIGQNGILYGLNPKTGSIVQQAMVGVPANHFPTPSVGDGLLLAPSSDRVVAFEARAATPEAPPATTTSPSHSKTTTTTTTSSSAPAKPASDEKSSGGGVPVAAIAGGSAGGLVVVGVAIAVLLRRRSRAVP
jgi:outer membrane protein assembly factor BamB